MKRVLGLDLGTNSLGWAILDVPDDDTETGAVIGMGSRVFPEGAEESGSKAATKCAERRQKRSMRRQIARRSQRRVVLRQQFTDLGLLPSDPDAFARLMDQDPNALLERSLKGEQMTLGEIGRVIYWFSSRRGFLSLRAGGSSVIDDDDEGFKPIRYRIRQFDSTTGAEVIRGQENVLVDFLKSQEKHYPNLIDDNFIFGRRGRLTYPVKPISKEDFLSGVDASLLQEFGVHGLVFFQRKVYWDRKTIGDCSLDKSSGKRAARAERLSQRFVIWQTLAHIKVGKDRRGLTRPERDQLFALLNSQKSLAFSKVRKKLKLDPDTPINFESDEKKGLEGNQTDTTMSTCLGATWDSFAEDEKNQIVFVLLGNNTEDQMRQALKRQFGLSIEQIDKVLKATFPSGRMGFSRKTLARILEFLPDADSLHDAIDKADFSETEAEFDLSVVTNPFVKASLIQVQKVLKSLIRNFERSDGTAFDVVRIELTRDVSNSVRKRKEIEKKQAVNRKMREVAKDQVKEWSPGAENSRDSIRRYQLWNDQGQRCLYTGKTISAADVLSNKYQLDHILPRSLTMNNSLGNLVLVAASENQDKGDRTIYEWGGEEKVNDIAARARSMKLKGAKIRNIEKEHVDGDAIPSSLLVQTGYINRLARDYIKSEFGIEPEVSRGRLTAHMLYRCGLKKDSDDHRRHAQDAAMVALTNARMAQKLAKRYKKHVATGEKYDDDFGGFEPWKGFRTEITQKYEGIIVSHRAARKVSGQLHEETYYGKVNSPGDKRISMYARRRPLSAGFSTLKQLNEVADPVVKASLMDNLKRRGQDPEIVKKFTFDEKDLPVMPDGTPIVRVRCHMNLPSNASLRPESQPKTGVTLGNNYATYIYKNTKTDKWRLNIVSRFDYFLLRGISESELRSKFKQDNEEFLFSVTIGEILSLTNPETKIESFVVVKQMDGEGSRIGLKSINDSTTNQPIRFGFKRLSESLARKVLILPDGSVRRAND